MLHQQVKCLHIKKLCVYHFKSTINRKQSRVKYVKSAVQVAELDPGDLPVSSPRSQVKPSFFGSSSSSSGCFSVESVRVWET